MNFKVGDKYICSNNGIVDELAIIATIISVNYHNKTIKIKRTIKFDAIKISDATFRFNDFLTYYHKVEV